MITGDLTRARCARFMSMQMEDVHRRTAAKTMVVAEITFMTLDWLLLGLHQ